MRVSVTAGRRAGAAAIVASLFGAVLFALVPTAHATAQVTTTRYGGTDRYDTARLLAEAAFPGGSLSVLLARGDDFPDGSPGFPDALSGNYLSGFYAAPLLLTDGNSVPSATLQALRELKTKQVRILGGTVAVSQAVQNQLASTPSTSSQGGDLTVSRIAGTDRYDTAHIAAETPGASYVHSIGGLRTAMLARGDDFPDALVGGPVSDAGHLPLLLTNPTTLSSSASQTFKDLNIQHVVILGGDTAVSAATEASVDAMGITTERLAGATRMDTAVAVANWAITHLAFSNAKFGLARGDAYPDALAAGDEAVNADPQPIVLTEDPTTLSSPTSGWIQSHNQTIDHFDIYGGEGAVSQAVVSQASGTATCTPTSTTSTSMPTTTSSIPPCSSPTTTTTSASTTTSSTSSTTSTSTTAPTTTTTVPCITRTPVSLPTGCT